MQVGFNRYGPEMWVFVGRFELFFHPFHWVRPETYGHGNFATWYMFGPLSLRVTKWREE